MENKISAAKSGLQLGVFFGIIMILELVVGYVLNIDPSTNKSFGIAINLLNFLVLPCTVIYLGCSNFKKLNSGYITISESLKVGVSICTLAALISGVFSAIFNFLIPEYFEEIINKAKVAMMRDNPQMTNEQIEMGISFMKKFSNPVISIPSTIVMYAFIGLILSLIIGLILKKDAYQSH